MSKQRYVRDSFWTDPYIEKLDPSEKLLFLYFLTNPLCNIAGIYEIRNNRVAYETGFDKDMVEKIKNRFIEDGKMITIKDWIILVNFVKNQSNNPSVLQGIQRILDDLPQEVLELLTGCTQAGGRLSYFTLLNLTLPNLTLRENTEDLKTNSSSKEIPEIIKEFESINPACKRMYGNKTQRKACEDLIETYGFEKVIFTIREVLPKVKGLKFFPTITTPLQLCEKWSALESAVARYKQDANKIKFI